MEERRAFAVEANENASSDGRQVASSTYSARLGDPPAPRRERAGPTGERNGGKTVERKWVLRLPDVRRRTCLRIAEANGSFLLSHVYSIPPSRECFRMEQEPSSPRANTSRRDFVRYGVAAAAAPVLAPLAAHATPHASAPSATSADLAGSGATPGQDDAMAAHLTEALKARYGTRLTDEQWAAVRAEIEATHRAAGALHDFPLPIQTEPAFVFRAFRGGER